jgi:hypothetical protein
MMELVNNKGQFWQGWNDFLGTNSDDTHNYILNIIIDIKDGFRVTENLKKLGERLISDKSDSYLFHSQYSYKNNKPNSTRWLQVRIYKVDEHFIILMYGHNAIIWCEYAGTDLMVAIEKFFEYYSDGFLMMLLKYEVSSRLVKKSTAKELYPDNYVAGEFRFNLYHEEYIETLKVTLSKRLENKKLLH